MPSENTRLGHAGEERQISITCFEEWTGMECTIKVYKNTLIGATKRIDNQFSAFSSLPFPKLDVHCMN